MITPGHLIILPYRLHSNFHLPGSNRNRIPRRNRSLVPTLHNVDKRPDEDFVKACAHNGYFKSLEEIVHFYNTRDVPGEGWNGTPWPAPEVSDNVNTAELGDLKLTPLQEEAIVAFMKTLSDWYIPEPE
jgi:cytochrome c peroxidase